MKTFGCRSKFSLLPQRVRWYVYNLLLDGATLKTLLADPVFGEALNRAGISFNSDNLRSVRHSPEFAEFSRMRQKFLETKYHDMMLSAIVRKSGVLESMTDQARCKLMEALTDLSDLSDRSDQSDESRIKAVRSLSQSLASLSNPAKDNQIAELKRKLREKEKQLQAAEQKWKAREAELLLRIAELENAPKNVSGMSKETLAEVEDKIKLL